MIGVTGEIKSHKITLTVQPLNREYELTVYEINGVFKINSSERNEFVRKLLRDIGAYIGEAEDKHADLYKICNLD